MKVVITGGHHSSAIPVIYEIRKNYPEWELYWFGHRHSMRGDKNDTLEFKEVTSLGIPFYDINAGKFYHVYNPFKMLKILKGIYQSYVLLKKIKPDIIVSFGGYVAVPVILSGWFLKIPSLTHEQTLVAGYANKLIAKFVKKVMISWESSRKYFNPRKVVLTGIPIRDSIFTVKSDEFETPNSLPYVLVMGGKTGSHILNKLIINNMEMLLNKYNLIHQCGDHSRFNDFQTGIEKYKLVKGHVPGEYFIRKFILEDVIGEAYARASVVVSRAGAHTISELEVLSKQAVLIPISWVSHNEQFENAKYLSDQGLASIISEDQLTITKLVSAIDGRLQLKETNSQNTLISRENVAKRILDEIVLTAQENKN